MFRWSTKIHYPWHITFTRKNLSISVFDVQFNLPNPEDHIRKLVSKPIFVTYEHRTKGTRRLATLSYSKLVNFYVFLFCCRGSEKMDVCGGKKCCAALLHIYPNPRIWRTAPRDFLLSAMNNGTNALREPAHGGNLCPLCANRIALPYTGLY